MKSDEDVLYIKVVVVNEFYNFVVQTFLFEIVLIPKYPSQDFIEFIPKEFMCCINPSECLVVGNELRWRNNHNKSSRSR